MNDIDGEMMINVAKHTFLIVLYLCWLSLLNVVNEMLPVNAKLSDASVSHHHNNINLRHFQALEWWRVHRLTTDGK